MNGSLGRMRKTLGALYWTIAGPLFLTANVIVGLAWNRPPYSWATANISDLGNVTCGIWDTSRPRLVCSPWHTSMNVVILLTAALLAAGAVLAWRGWLARSLLLLTSLGYALAGFFPADVNENAHVLGALLIMGFGNAGLIAAAGRFSGWLRGFTVAMGLIAIAGTVLFFSQQGLGIGVGGMERVAVFPLLIWTTVVGIHWLRGRATAALA
jgi:hypothetical membrane protein